MDSKNKSLANDDTIEKCFWGSDDRICNAGPIGRLLGRIENQVAEVHVKVDEVHTKLEKVENGLSKVEEGLGRMSRKFWMSF
jgi:hypothetical protein